MTRQPDEQKFVLIYTTAAPTKPSYRRGILDALCYPNGHIIPYSYRRHHIEPALLRDTKHLAGKEAVIIFVDLDANRKVTYFPLRRATIRNVTFDTAETNPPSMRERVNLSLLLQDFVEYEELGGVMRWNERVGKFDGVRQIVNGKPTYFVIAGSDDFPRCNHSVGTAWEDLVTAVSKSAGFPNAVFLRLDHIKPYDSGRENEQLHRYEGDRLVYSLLPGSIYRMNLSVFESLSSNAGNETKLEILTSAKDVLEAVQPFQSIVSGLAEKSTLIACKRTIENVITTLTVRLDPKGPASNAVNSPSPTLFARISVSRLTLWAFLASVFLGGFGVSIDKDMASELCFISHPATAAVVAKVAGAFLLAVAAFLAFRKLPSGER